jgi:hypothetical protein
LSFELREYSAQFTALSVSKNDLSLNLSNHLLKIALLLSDIHAGSLPHWQLRNMDKTDSVGFIRSLPYR